MIARAYAKINLALRVGPRDASGYHELETIFQTISLHDELHIEPADDFSLTIAGDASLSSTDNLVTRAAHALAREAGVLPRAYVHLVKRIPTGGGLGGGSSDAATTLRALDSLWRTGATPSDLHRLATELGADVPFFLLGGTALGLGRGERLFAINELPALSVVLALPGVFVSTRDAFQSFDRAGAAGVARPWPHARLWTWSDGCFEDFENDLESSVFALHPQLAELRGELARQGAELARMSGSGSTIFGLFREPAQAAAAAATRFAGNVRTEVAMTLDRATLRGASLPA